MRTALVLAALLGAGPALAEPASVTVQIIPAEPCDLEVEVGQPQTFTCVSGLPLDIAIEVVPDGTNYRTTVHVRSTSDRVDAPDLSRVERRNIRSLGPIDANPTLLLRPGQQGEFFSGGSTPQSDETQTPFGLQITVVPPAD